jgi:hypothetical protein
VVYVRNIIPLRIRLNRRRSYAVWTGAMGFERFLCVLADILRYRTECSLRDG